MTQKRVFIVAFLLVLSDTIKNSSNLQSKPLGLEFSLKLNAREKEIKWKSAQLSITTGKKM